MLSFASKTVDQAKRYFLSALIISTITTAIILQSGFVHALSLTNWNVTELNASGDWVDVTIGTDGSGNTTLDVQWFAGAGNLLAGIGIDKFAFNSTATVLTCPTGWNCNLGSGTMDGFGLFAETNTDPGGSDGISSPIHFVLNGATTFSLNSNEGTMAAHVRYESNCSGFVSDGRAGVDSNASCGAEQVPEPSTLLLLGGGLVGLGFIRRKLKV